MKITHFKFITKSEEKEGFRYHYLARIKFNIFVTCNYFCTLETVNDNLGEDELYQNLFFSLSIPNQKELLNCYVEKSGVLGFDTELGPATASAFDNTNRSTWGKANSWRNL